MDSRINTVLYKQTLDRLCQMLEQEAGNEKDKELLKKDWHQEVQLSLKYK